MPSTKPASKWFWAICANSLALLGISLPKAYSPAFISNCHTPTPTFSIVHLVYNKCKTEYYNPGTDEQELATPILSLCHCIFTD